MACVVNDLASASTAGCRQRGRAVPVIADDGLEAGVVVVRFSGPPRRGDRFEHGGRTWEIVREQDHLRGYVARPIDRMA